ncbi:MAG: LacI family DNA-binding transcriptional regulator [Chloroflexi bacterium]|nr:LacI family DNA-binding transcriptional regulator [Chloroflexota bacterium]
MQYRKPAEAPEQAVANVTVPDHSIGYVAAQYLIAHRHKRIGIVGGFIRTPHIADRITGFQQALKENGLGMATWAGVAPDVPTDPEEKRQAIGEEPLVRWRAVAREALSSLTAGGVTGLFCPFDSVALALASELSESHVARARAESTGVVAVTTSQWPEIVALPHIAHFLLPVHQMGYEAARLLTRAASIGMAKMTVHSLELQCEFHIAHRN